MSEWLKILIVIAIMIGLGRFGLLCVKFPRIIFIVPAIASIFVFGKIVYNMLFDDYED